MRRRLQHTYVTLLAAVLLGLDIPLAITLASRDTQEMVIDRQSDAIRFAALADPALRSGRTTDGLQTELRQHDALYGIAVAVVSRDGRLVLGSRGGLDPADPVLKEAIDEALSGQRVGIQGAYWPWQDGPIVVAEPVGQAGDAIGAVVTISPTNGLTLGTWRNWGLLFAASALVLVAGVAAAAPLARWMLRPVRDLDDAAQALAAGQFDDRVTGTSGPAELRNLVASFNAMAERIASLVARQHSFVSYASHQLRTPLATLQLCVENLGPSVRREGNDDYRMVAEEIERMTSMCDALLAYARADATAEDAEDMDAAAVVETRVGIWRQAAVRAGVTLSRAGHDVAPVRVAVQALDQALDALLSNAVKFVGSGATVVVTVQRVDASWVDIHVVDNGPGLPPDALDRAAEPFWRGPNDQNVQGSGLGVTIADALIRASGGRLDLFPAHPHGLHARIRLPAARPAPPRARTAAWPARPEGVRP